MRCCPRAQLQHPILDSLVGTEHEPIKHLLYAFNAGDIAQFEKLVPSLAAEVRFGS